MKTPAQSCVQQRTSTSTGKQRACSETETEREREGEGEGKRERTSCSQLGMDEFEIFRRQSLHGGRADTSAAAASCQEVKEQKQQRSGVQQLAFQKAASQSQSQEYQRRFTVHDGEQHKSSAKLSLTARRSVDRLPCHARLAQADSPATHAHAHSGEVLYETAPVQLEDVKLCHLNSVIGNSWCSAPSQQSAFCTKPVLKSKAKKERSRSVPKSVAFDLTGYQNSCKSFAVPATYYVQVLGSASVGKSTLCSQFAGANNEDPDDEVMEDGEAEADSEFSKPRRISVVLDGEESVLIFLHTVAQAELERVSIVSGVHAYLVVYAIDDQASFQFAHSILEAILVNNDMKTAVVLVANKSDLARCKEVRTEDGKSLAEKYGCTFLETSATLQHRVEDLLVELLKQIRQAIVKQTQFALQSSSLDTSSLTADYLASTDINADGDQTPQSKHGIFCSILRRISKHK